MRYVRSDNGTIVESEDIQEYLDKGYWEISKDDAYLLLFDKISHRLGAKFSNYGQLDLCSELYLWLLRQYKAKGEYRKDKTFADNERMYYSVATKRCYWYIREYKKLVAREVLLSEADSSIFEETFEFEERAGVDAIIAYIYTLANSNKYSDKQLGLYALSKLSGASDEEICDILEIGKPRFFELKRALKTKIYKFIEENL